MKLDKIADSIYRLTETNGKEQAEVITLYLFPGIYLGINNIHMQRLKVTMPGSIPDKSAVSPPDIFRINYCLEGRCEIKLKDGQYVYVDNNVLCMESHAPTYNFYYPLGFYKGIEIYIDKKTVPNAFCELFDLFGINLFKLIEQYGNKDETFIRIASDLFVNKAAEIIAIWEDDTILIENKIYEFRFILCRLFYYLLHDLAVDKEKIYNASSLSHGQYRIALDCERRITADLSRKLTITSMAADYKISPSSLKKFFTMVYGCGISEYLQTMRMKEAACLLAEENLSIMQVAAKVGYENQSKFSAVFKKHTGHAPLEYKRIHAIKRNEEEEF